ncbi:MAG: class I SAM-dependent methyltransferase, partial [Kiloniellaceae bacterium]
VGQGRLEVRLAAGAVALVHADVGSANAARDAELAAFIGRYLPAVLHPGGVAAADRDVAFAGARPLALPEDFAPGTYFMYALPACGVAASAARRA